MCTCMLVVEGKEYPCLWRYLLWILEEPELLDLYQISMGQLSSCLELSIGTWSNSGVNIVLVLGGRKTQCHLSC